MKTDYRNNDNIKIPKSYYEHTRSFIDIEGSSVQIPMQVFVACFVSLFAIATFYFCQIMYDHLIYYLVLSQQSIDEMDDLIRKTKANPDMEITDV